VPWLSVSVDVAGALFRDIATMYFQAVRHSSMSKKEQRALIELVEEAVHRKLAASGTRESDNIVRQEQSKQERQKANGQTEE
jgi:hypothetical protein